MKAASSADELRVQAQDAPPRPVAGGGWWKWGATGSGSVKPWTRDPCPAPQGPACQRGSPHVSPGQRPGVPAHPNVIRPEKGGPTPASGREPWVGAPGFQAGHSWFDSISEAGPGCLVGGRPVGTYRKRRRTKTKPPARIAGGVARRASGEFRSAPEDADGAASRPGRPAELPARVATPQAHPDQAQSRYRSVLMRLRDHGDREGVCIGGRAPGPNIGADAQSQLGQRRVGEGG